MGRSRPVFVLKCSYETIRIVHREFDDGISSEVVFALNFVGVIVFLVRDRRRLWKQRRESN
ncbi:hypothetical protein A4G99_06855 [Haladaptatus sp. R4]|nr:hypothetical protein A4G99_06855 [Haladaptatus sp. R4]